MHQDFKELLSAFNAGQVRYLIVGGYAVSFHGVDVRIGDALSVKFISREDLLVAKLSAGRAQDLIDVDALRESDASQEIYPRVRTKRWTTI